MLLQKIVYCWIGALLIWPTMAYADEGIMLLWDASTSPNIVAYKIYFGNASRKYAYSVKVGNVTSAAITGLGEGTWYFTCTALDKDGNESDYSNEVSKTIAALMSRCDLTRDNVVDVLDLQMMVKAIASGSPIPAGDLNRDGATNSIDLQILANVIMGRQSCP